MDTKDIIKYAAIAAAAYLVYTYIIAPMMTTSASTSVVPATPVSPTTPAAGATTAGSTTTATPLPCPAGYTGYEPNCIAIPVSTAVNNTFASSDYGTPAWAARVSSAMASAAGGNGQQDFDNWSYYYQNQAEGSPISASLMQGIINAGGGNRAALITAPAFLGFLVSANSANLSGLGDIVYVGAGLGNLWGMQ